MGRNNDNSQTHRRDDLERVNELFVFVFVRASVSPEFTVDVAQYIVICVMVNRVFSPMRAI